MAIDDEEGISFGEGVTMKPAADLQKKLDKQNEKKKAKAEKIKADMEDRVFTRDRRDEAKHYANSQFKANRIKEAGISYERLLPLCDDDDDLTVAVLSNLAAVRLREWKWKEALSCIDRVLEMRPKHAKAMYRQAQAFRGMRELELALDTIDKSREVTEPDNKAALAELDNLESGVRKEIDRRDREVQERREAAARKDRKLREQAKKQQRKLDARREGAGIPLPPAGCGAEALPTGEIVAQSSNWTPWLYGQMKQVMCDEDNRYMLYEEDGWMEIHEFPETKQDMFAQVRTSENGDRSLHYEFNGVFYGMATQCKAPNSEPGMMGFHINIHVKNCDNLTPPDEWIIYADYCKPSDYKPARRIKKIMEEYVRPGYVPYIRELVMNVLDSMVQKASGRDAPAKLVKAKKPEPPPEDENAPKITEEKIRQVMEMMDKMDEEDRVAYREEKKKKWLEDNPGMTPADYDAHLAAEKAAAEKAAAEKAAAEAAAGGEAGGGGDDDQDDPLPPPEVVDDDDDDDDTPPLEDNDEPRIVEVA